MTDKNHNEPEIMSRAGLIRLCGKILSEMDKKLSGRYRPGGNENLYLQAVRALTGLISTANQILKDDELNELEKRINALEALERQKERVYE